MDFENQASQEINIKDHSYQRERLFDQDPALLEAISSLATKIRSCPVDPKFPDIEPTALIVGGFVRDALLGKKPKDADVEVYGISPERLESLLDQLFEEKVNKVGRSFGILKVQLENGFDFDVSIPRRESKSGAGHKGFVINSDPGMSPEEASLRRDFTMNSIAADILSGEVMDPYGGLEDIQNKILRVTDPDRFQGDPLRVYRAVQFAARMDLSVEDTTLSLLKEMVKRGDLDELPPERITEELRKLFLKSEKPSIGLELARKLGIIEKYYPELESLVGVMQEPEWHPEGDVWTHTKMTVDAAAKLVRDEDRGFSDSEKIQIMLGALCHDLGKALTTEVIEGRTRSLGHEEAGIIPSEFLMKKFSFGEDVLSAVKVAAGQHLKPNMLFRAKEKGEMNDAQYVNAVRKLLRRIHPVSWKVLIAVSEADSLGRGLKDVENKRYETGELFAKTISELGLEKESVRPLISGRDIIQISSELGIDLQPGHIFGKLIREIEEERDEGILNTKEEGLQSLKRKLIKLQ